jgi:hypothetical protein
MGNLQVKNVPDDLYAELRRRAAGAGVTLRDYVLGLIAADQRLPSVGDWADDLHTHEPVALTADEVVNVIAEGRHQRGEWPADGVQPVSTG